MALRYRVDLRGWYVPQFKMKEEDEWQDFKRKHLGEESCEIHRLAYDLGVTIGRFGDKVYHYKPIDGQKEEEMSLVFNTEIKVCAFLGAATIVYSQRVHNFNLNI